MRSVVTLSLPPKLAREIDRNAKRLGLSRSEVVRRLLERTLLEDRFDELCRELKAGFRSESIVTDEDVFERVS